MPPQVMSLAPEAEAKSFANLVSCAYSGRAKTVGLAWQGDRDLLLFLSFMRDKILVSA